MKTLFIIPVLMASLSSCVTVAQTERENRQIDPFTKVKVQNGVDLYLTQSDAESLRIEAKGYDPDDVVAEVDGGELKIYREGGPWRIGSIKVYLSFKELTAIEASGGSDVRGENQIAAEELYIKVSGGSDVKMELRTHYLECSATGGSDIDIGGSAEAIRAHASGGSDISAAGFRVQRGFLELSGGSDAVVYITEEVEIHASGGSDVVVHGNPGKRNLRNDRSSDVAWR